MEERPVRRPRQGGRRPKRKVCAFCADKNAVIDYKVYQSAAPLCIGARKDFAAPHDGHLRKASA